MILNHLLISLPSWLIGILAGSGLGYGCARVVQQMASTQPSRAQALRLLPWRTVLVSVLLLIPYVPILVGLGPLAGVVIVGLMIALLALPISAAYFLDEWNPSPPRGRLIGTMRSLAVLSLVLMVFTGLFGGGTELSFTFWQGIQTLDIPSIQTTFWTVFFMALVLDLLFGAAEMTLVSRIDA